MHIAAVWSKHSRERICPTIVIAPVIDDRQRARLGYLVCVRAAEFATVAQSLSHLDARMVLISVGLSLLAGLLAGIYPAWRIGRMAPATFLKIQ
ncbi:MAG: hypothetical protein M3N91_07290 [Pseudomonadota bacterium]|nr:hypothetical protein [Pseudomonadota bacterium]